MDADAQKVVCQQLAKDPTVRVAYLFGSRARGDEHQSSDVDLGIHFGSPVSFSDIDSLHRNLRSRLPGHQFDIVDLDSAPPELAFRVIDEGDLLYSSSEYERVELEACIASRYGDFLPVLRRQRQSIIEGRDYEPAIRRYRKALGKTRRLLEQARTAGRKTDQ